MLKSLKGKTYTCLAVDPVNEELGEVEVFDWTDAILDSFIVSMITFLSSLVVTQLFTLDWAVSLIGSLIEMGISFFTLMSIKRGIKEKA